MNPPRGMPLLSGPPPPPSDTGRAEIACRKCNKEFNIIFTRARRCNHCGYSYCHSCSDYQALMPRETRSGTNAGYDPAPVCAFCIEMLNVTATPPAALRQMPLAKLKRYVTAYGIKSAQLAVEKEEMVRAVVGVRGQNGCLPLENERFYRRHSVPKHPDSAKPRGLFSSRPEGPPPPAQPPRETRPEFPRPDLAPDGPPSTPPRGAGGYAPPGSRSHYQPPPGSGSQYQPPPGSGSQYQPPPGPPPPLQGYSPQHQQGYAPQYHSPPSGGYGYQQYAPPPGSPPRTSARPPHPPPPQSRPGGPQARPTPAASTTSPPPASTSTSRPPPPPPQTTRPPSPPPPPTLDELVDMSEDGLAGLSVHNLKGILRANHVPLGQVLEKADLVTKVKALVAEERRAREAAEAAERGEVPATAPEPSTSHEVPRGPSPMPPHEAAQPPSSTSSADGAPPSDGAAPDSTPAHVEETGASVPPSPPPASDSSPPKAAKPSPATSYADRPGLCVVCQDEDAVLAIVDCGHLALCAPCAALVMRSTRECPLCRTRIVTEQRLLRIWRT
ncbi:hypothetical protein GGF50DRAFT_118876 [Schizophyllum commune]